MDSTNPGSDALMREATPDIFDMRLDALRTVKDGNAHTIVNALVVDEGREAIRQKNGDVLTPTAKRMIANAERKTRQAIAEPPQEEVAEKVQYQAGRTLPASKKALEAELTDRKNHSSKLDRNLKAAGEVKPIDAEKGALSSHHIVAVNDDRAFQSRELIFGWGIGINDVDNGVRLPRWLSSVRPVSLPNATVHSILHTDRYFTAVQARLRQAFKMNPTQTETGRVALRLIKSELVGGVFPW